MYLSAISGGYQIQKSVKHQSQRGLVIYEKQIRLFTQKKDDMMFGGILELHLDSEGQTIPRIVELCCLEVEARGINSVGIYRLSGNAATIQKIRSSLNKNEPIPSIEELDINVVTNLLKCLSKFTINYY